MRNNDRIQWIGYVRLKIGYSISCYKIEIKRELYTSPDVLKNKERQRERKKTKPKYREDYQTHETFKTKILRQIEMLSCYII